SAARPKAGVSSPGNSRRQRDFVPCVRAAAAAMRSYVASGPTDSRRPVVQRPSNRGARNFRSARADTIFTGFSIPCYNCALSCPVWHGARIVTLRADAQTSIQLNILTLWRIQMQIENLNKDLDTETMTDVKGGLALTGQVVPTNVQSNELLQNFRIASGGPVAIANDADQSNESDQESFVPVGSIFVAPYLSKLVR